MNKGMKRLLAGFLALLLLGGALPLAAGAAELPPMSAPQDYARALSQLAAKYWDDGFFAAMTLTAGEAEYSVDGETAAAAVAPELAYGEALLPTEAVARVRELPAGVLQSAQPLMTIDQAEALGLEVRVCDEEITVTAPYQTRRLLVKTAQGQPGDTYGAVTVLPLSDNRFALQYATEAQARNACERLEGDPGVLYAEPDGIMSASAVIKSGEGAAALQARSWGTDRIGAPAFQALLPASPPRITVAVLDTGVDVNHTFLAGRITAARWNFVGNNNNPADIEGHGTHVSGIVADASPANVQIMPVKVLGDDGKGADSVIAEGLRYAADNGAQIANMSLGSPGLASNTWGEAILYAQGKGMTLVAAAGNEGRDEKSYPAAIPGVIAVAASTSSDYFWSSSNRGDWVDLGAPGYNILSAFPGNKTLTASGTSMAAPHVSAAVALVLSYCAMPQNEILPYLVSLCDKWKDSGDTSKYGAGILNLTPRNASPTMQASLAAGETALLKVSQSPPILGQQLIFASADPSVVAVSPGGGFAALQAGKTNVTVSGAGGLITTVEVTVKGVAAITITSAPLGILSEGPLACTATISVFYTDGSTKSLQVDESFMSGFVQGQTGWQTLTITYGGQTAQFTAWADVRQLLDLSLSPRPKTSYYYGEEFDVLNAKMYVRFSGSSGTYEPLTAAAFIGYEKNSYVNQEIDVKWQGRIVDSLRFTVSMSYSPDYYFRGTTVPQAPTQTAVPPLEPVSGAGGIVRINLDHRVTGVSSYVDVPMEQIVKDRFRWSYTTSLRNNLYEIGIFLYGWSGGTVHFSLKTPNPAAGISLVTLPTKLSYSAGEAIDPTGGVVRFTAHDGTTFDYPLQAQWCSWGAVTTGKRTIDVTVRNYQPTDTSTSTKKWAISTSFEVSDPAAVPPAPVTFSGLAVAAPPTKTEYTAGEKLDTAGGKLRLSLSDGSAVTINLKPEHCTGFNPNQLGTQTVTASLSGKTAAFTVTVKPRAKGIEILTLPAKLVYRVYEALDLTGGTVRVTNGDGTSETLPMASPRLRAVQGSGGTPGMTCFDMVMLICDDIVSAEFTVVYVNSNGYLNGLTGSDTLYYKTDYVTLPRVDLPDVHWESTNTRVLTINANGTINFKGRGSTSILLVFEPQGRSRVTVGKLDIRVEYTFLQWLLVIFLFGWIWL